jgi:plastocyanin
MRRFGWVLAALAAVGMCGGVGCKSKSPELVIMDKVPARAQFDPATLGSVSGVVQFAGKAPAPIKIDTSMDPACGFGGGGDAYSEQYAVKDGKLGNVYVYVKSMQLASGTGTGSGSASTGPPVVLDQKGCVYTPHAVAVQIGNFVEFRNEDPTMHNVHTMPTMPGNAAVDISQGPRGMPQRKQFNKPEVMIPVRCNNHPWMQAFINVSETPWFAVTGPDGSFQLRGMPPGEYTIGAVQEKMGEQTVTVTVKAQSEAKADFTFAMK